MTDYTKLVKALRGLANGTWKNCEYTWFAGEEKVFADAAAAIEELQQTADHYEQTAKDYWKEACEYKAQLPKRGKWEVKGANRVDCSVCGHSICFAFGLSEGSLTGYNYCPNCGAKMEVQE